MQYKKYMVSVLSKIMISCRLPSSARLHSSGCSTLPKPPEEIGPWKMGNSLLYKQTLSKFSLHQIWFGWRDPDFNINLIFNIAALSLAAFSRDVSAGVKFEFLNKKNIMETVYFEIPVPWIKPCRLSRLEHTCAYVQPNKYIFDPSQNNWFLIFHTYFLTIRYFAKTTGGN